MQDPRSRLRIILFEMREESGVGEMLEARGVVSHDIEFAGQVECLVAITVEALVMTGVVAEVCGCS